MQPNEDIDAVITRAVRLLHRAGVTYADAAVRLDRALQNQYRHGLTAAEWAALREPGAKRHTATLERMIGAGLAEHGGQEDGVVRCTFDRVRPQTRRQHPDTLFVRHDCDNFADLVNRMSNCVLENATAHNLGWDLGQLVDWDEDDKKLVIQIRQLKLGATPIGATGGDRSMQTIADKIESGEDIIESALEQEYNVWTEFVRTLDTTAALAGNAGAVAHRNRIKVNNAQTLWRTAWLQPHRDALVALYGRERAPYLG